ncbi:MAG: chromosomal replication initiator protein DnaA [Candidatus Blackburnbacteria bacterium RIFCSPHIGHO2_01_FULL_43_15b]|uniref:Chromosomal replication initiator protein DnaA n=1 Tax=Candidatus Blackburnbacteria bacterium RIFCSPHIGHO2_01_FULL_43_15b TaxID=1797513 RepID=A0A1G1UY88_9BACT|nr:MAG: chromosomal replication initiator protein DnaA [Candidatus Blackburnbacteria bacterium RIFCSPHIGHO2_01_FULL_43_15b]
MDQNYIWKNVLSTLKVSLSQANFQTWFSSTFIVSLKKISDKRQAVEIGCSSSFIADGIEKRYFDLLQDALNQTTTLKNDITFVVRQKVKKPNQNEPLFASSQIENTALITDALKRGRVRPGFTFENFAVSGTNQMAHAAAEAVSRNPGHAYNPLFFYGGVGIGKTHLMLAIAHSLLEKDLNTRVAYCTGEDFTNEIVEAIRSKTTQTFKEKYRKLKLLMVDDIQFIAGKERVQEEFFHTFNTLQSAGSQIVLTSDRPPHEIDKLEARLRSRFEAGLIVDIAPPDFELRAAITLIKAKERGVELPMEIAQAIAANIDSPRRIEGFLTKLTSHLAITHEPLTVELVNKLLSVTSGDTQTYKKPVSPQAVINAVSIYYSLGKRSLLGESRAQTVALPRQILMYILRTDLRLPLQEVGRLVGGRDHTTVMHAVDKISKNISEKSGLHDDILGIKKSIS